MALSWQKAAFRLGQSSISSESLPTASTATAPPPVSDAFGAEDDDNSAGLLQAAARQWRRILRLTPEVA